MDFATLQLQLTKHGHRQYCARVGRITYAELYSTLHAAIHAGRFEKRKGEFLKVDDVWWIAKIRKGCLYLVTCFGRSDLDLPEALRWAKRRKDRIRLGGEVLCDGNKG